MTYIRHIETITPAHRYKQREIGAFFKKHSGDNSSKRFIEGIYHDSGIDYRYSVIRDLISDNGCLAKKYAETGIELSTGERNEIYAKEAKPLLETLARNTFDNCPDVEAQEITHIITVSCTGFYSPGPDIDLVKSLKLSKSVERYNLGFMGCYAALPALRMAKQFCEADRSAVVLVVCLELCSLHQQFKEDLDTIVANSLFSDGAAAVIITGESGKEGSLELSQFNAALLPGGEEDMAWRIGDFGFDLVLSKYVPRIIAANLYDLVGSILKNMELSLADIDNWAIHPGGKSIVDKVAESLNLREEQLKASRKVLREYGNMSSATILFVLREMLLDIKKNNLKKQKIFALAFGPGLTVESAIISSGD